MNCANHPEVNAATFCRECGKPMCEACERPALGSVYCEEHLPVASVHDASLHDASVHDASVPRQPPPLPEPPRPSPAGYRASSYAGAASSPYTAPLPAAGPVPEPSVHPVLALILGFFPGVGAIYNGQYAKGLVHAVIFGLLISLESNSHNGGMHAFLGVMIAIWVIYQAFEAYHTARKRRYGIVVEEFSSLFEIRHTHGRFPISAILLIGVGFILLLDTTDIVSMERFERYWPVLMIGVGLYMLYARLNPSDHANGAQAASNAAGNGGGRR